MPEGTCSVDGCETPAKYRGWCNKHYQRWLNHGDPTALALRLNGQPRVARGEGMATFDRLYASAGDDCVVWPHNIDVFGYGCVTVASGVVRRTHAVACERAHGERPTPDHVVAHNCRTRACFNPNHLRWATQAENIADKVRDDTVAYGERNPMAKLTAGQAEEIRRSVAEGANLGVLAEAYGVSRSTISRCARGESWAHPTGATSR